MTADQPGPLGLVLAAGAGQRMGVPKALLRTEDGRTWAERAARVLTDAGCPEVVVVLGAEAPAVLRALPAGVPVVVAQRWSEGVGESVAAGLRAAQHRTPRPDAVVIHLVDLPGVTPAAVRRLIERAGSGPDVLARATYAGQPGHPVIIGRAHWDDLLVELGGDHGATRYLAEHPTLAVECGDLADGQDVDTPERPPEAAP